MTQNRMLVGKLVFALAIGIGVFAGCKKYEGDSTDDSVSAERWRRWRHPQSDSGGTDTTSTPGTTPGSGTSSTPTGPTFTFTQLTSDFSRPGAGAEKWHYDWVVPIPNVQIQDQYFRFCWAGLNPGDGLYDWSFFDQQLKSAIDNKYKFSFGIMTQYDVSGSAPGVVNFPEGGNSAYPKWLHDKFQAESVKDYKYASSWVPNWNSPSYFAALEKFYKALNDHLYNTTYKNVKFSDVILWIDIRGYGNFGEWHGYPWKTNEPAANAVTAASLIKIIDIHKISFPNFQLQAMIAGFDPGQWSKMPPEVTYKLLTDGNNAGPFGWRRDSWGNTEPWYPAILENNSGSYNGKAFKTLIMDKWKTAPITGEPCCNSNYAELGNQVTRYHVVSFGNSNYGSVVGSNVVAASKLAGHRITIEGGSISTDPGAGKPFTVKLKWKNNGTSPTYENWNVVFELRNSSNATVWSGNSSFKLKLFLPEASSREITDNFTLPAIAAGTYKLVLVIKDPAGYRQPYPLAITGRNSDGSYNLNTVTIK